MPNIAEDYGQGAVNQAIYGEAAKPNIPVKNSRQHLHAVVNDNVEYDREGSLQGHHQDGQRVPIYFQQVSIYLETTAFYLNLTVPGAESTSALGIQGES